MELKHAQEKEASAIRRRDEEEFMNPPLFPKLLLTTSNANPHSTISGAIHERRKGATAETA